MILLLGGTSETAGLAGAMAARGWPVLVSMATDAALELPEGVRRRSGRLDAQGLADLCREENIRVLVDAGHPFATDLHRTSEAAAALAGVTRLRYARPASPLPPDAILASDPQEAARLAFATGGPVLLTTGSRHLKPYGMEARRTGLPLTVRVLDHPESLAACREAGLAPDQIVTGRGPFGVEANKALLAECRAAALVTKDSGEAGGLEAKADAARSLGVRLVIIRRPPDPGLDAQTLLETLASLEVMHASR